MYTTCSQNRVSKHVSMSSVLCCAMLCYAMLVDPVLLSCFPCQAGSLRWFHLFTGCLKLLLVELGNDYDIDLYCSKYHGAPIVIQMWSWLWWNQTLFSSEKVCRRSSTNKWQRTKMCVICSLLLGHLWKCAQLLSFQVSCFTGLYIFVCDMTGCSFLWKCISVCACSSVCLTLLLASGQLTVKEAFILIKALLEFFNCNTMPFFFLYLNCDLCVCHSQPCLFCG